MGNRDLPDIYIYIYIYIYISLCISCNMGKRNLPDMYAQNPEGRRPEG